MAVEFFGNEHIPVGENAIFANRIFETLRSMRSHGTVHRGAVDGARLFRHVVFNVPRPIEPPATPTRDFESEENAIEAPMDGADVGFPENTIAGSSDAAVIPFNNVRTHAAAEICRIARTVARAIEGDGVGPNENIVVGHVSAQVCKHMPWQAWVVHVDVMYAV